MALLPPRAALALALGIGLAPAPARALSCQDWTRLGPDQQVARIRELSEEATSRPEPHGLEINPGALRRCLEENATAIDHAFDDTCTEGMEVELDALDDIFRQYVTSCQG